jgi:hypothetical protein
MLEFALSYGGFFLGALSIAATAYFAIKYAERKDPRLHVIGSMGIAISKSAPESVRVLYDGNEVPRISTAVVRFWNDGKRPIKSEDIPEEQPLKLVVTDRSAEVEILDVNVLKTSRDAISFKASKIDSNIIKIDFNFLDRNDGAAIEIQHTGTWRATVEPNGVILGATRGVRVIHSQPNLLPGINSLTPPLRLQTRRRMSVLRRLLVSIIIVALFGGIIWFFNETGKDLTTTPELIKKALETYLSPAELDAASNAICETSKYKTMNRILPIAFSVLMVVNMLYGLFIVWRKRFPFPSSLLIQKKIKETTDTQKDED